ncbi:MAG: hypothetical protein GF320_07960 [Armatimonadia bacterium]|nr:hypothetical protein [Armatimonadia bacterium]
MAAQLLFLACLTIQPGMLPDPADPPPAPLTTLDPLYWTDCARPGEMVGFSFLDPLPELRQATGIGANSALANWMWIPTQDDSAPLGLGGPPIHGLIGASRFAQSLRLEEPATALGLILAVYETEGVPVYLRVYQEGEAAPVAAAFVESPADNEAVWVPGEFEPGRYVIEVERAPEGPGRVAVWARPGDRPAAQVDGRSMSLFHLEALARSGDDVQALYDEDAPHMAFEMTGDLLEAWSELGLDIGIYVGNWNNGAFPYYPDWFYDRFPDVAMLDQYRQPLLSGMFDRAVPWVGLSHPVIVAGTTDHIQRTTDALSEASPLRYWVLGGESLYFTYMFGTRLSDYSAYSLDHFRGWLTERYGGHVTALNAAWDDSFADWADVVPPMALARDAASVDFALFRFEEMAERFGWHYQAVRSGDPERLTLSCNHGTLFKGRSYFGLGLDPSALAAMTDGFELGQIMSDDDGARYNLQWMYSVMGYGKPLAAPRLAYAKTDPSARGGSTSYTPEAARRYFGEAIGTGCWHAAFIQWYGDLPDGEWGVRGTPAEAEFEAIFDEWHQIEREFDGCWPLRPRVGLLRSRPTWAVEGYQPIWQLLHEELIARGAGYLPLSGEMSWDGLDAVICADNPILENPDRDRLRAFAQGGSLLLTSGDVGILDEACTETEGVDGWAGVVSIDADGPDLDRARALVDAALEEAPPAADLDLEALGPISRRITAGLASAGHDLPLDLAEGDVVQVFSPTLDGLAGVSVSVPTFAEQYEGDPLTLSVHDDGGVLLGSARVERDLMADNAWHEVTLDGEPEPGGVLRLTVEGPVGLEPRSLGVWASSTGGGDDAIELTQGGRSLDGALEMKLHYERGASPREVLEVFPLSDGAGCVLVLVNISDTPIRFSVGNAEDLVVAADTPVALRRLDHSTDLGDDVVSGHRTAYLAIHRDVSTDEVAAWLGRLGADGAGFLAQAREALEIDLPHKALAHGLMAARWVDTDATAEVEADELVVTARPRAAGEFGADELSITARVVPVGTGTVEMEREGESYRARIPLTELRPRYDYGEREYRRPWGPVQIEVRVWGRGRVGGQRLTVDLPPAE